MHSQKMIVLSHAFSIKLSIKLSLQIIDLNGINPVKFITTTQILHAQGNVIPFLGKQQIPEPMSL